MSNAPQPHTDDRPLPVALAEVIIAIHEADRTARAHLDDWSKGKLQHHLIHDHQMPPSRVMTNIAVLDRLHQSAHQCPDTA